MLAGCLCFGGLILAQGLELIGGLCLRVVDDLPQFHPLLTRQRAAVFTQCRHMLGTLLKGFFKARIDILRDLLQLCE